MRRFGAPWPGGKVDLFHGDDERVGYTLDVNTRGAGIRVPGPIATGEVLQLIFTLPGSFAPTIRAEAVVKRCVATDDSFLQAGIGVAFTRIGVRDSHELADFTESLAQTS